MGFFRHDRASPVGQDRSGVGRQDDARQIICRQLNEKMRCRRVFDRQHGNGRTFRRLWRDERQFRRSGLLPPLQFMVENRNRPADGQDIEEGRGGETQRGVAG